MDETESVPEKPSESVTQASGDASSSDKFQTREPVLDKAAEKCENVTSVVKSGSDTNPDISELENEESDLQNHVDHEMSVTYTGCFADLVNNDKDEEESMEVDSQDNTKHCDSVKEEDTQKESEETNTTDSEENQTAEIEDIVKDEIEEDSRQVESQDNNDNQDVISQNRTQDQSEKVDDDGFNIDNVKSDVDKDDEVGKPEFKTAPYISEDETQEDDTEALDPFDALLKDNNNTSILDTETPTTSKAETINALENYDDDHYVDHVDGEIDEEEQHTDNENEIEHEQEESIEGDKSLVSNVIQEISFTAGMTCVQCKQGVPCTYRYNTKDSESNFLCKQECVTAFVNEHPGFTVTCKKYVIEEIMLRFLTCSECEDKKLCYFYYNFDGEDSYYCSLKCLYGMMADEKDKYVFKRRRITVEEKTAKEAECSVCNEVKNCSYAMIRYGENNLICSTSCIKTLNDSENGRYVIKRRRSQRKPVAIAPANPPLLKLKVISNATDKYLDEAYKIQAKTPAMVQAAREERERTFLRRCNQCSLVLHEDKILTWETMDFCDEVCLGRYQNKIGARCANCQKAVQHTSLGKYCVRFGYDIRQFCNLACLEEFKKGLKICCYCQRDISVGHQGFLAPVGDKSQFKDFCSQLCMEKFDQKSKNPIPQPIWAKCAVCSLEKATAIEIEVNEDVSQRLCSDPCFAAFKFVNKVFPDQCRWCKKYFERKPSKCYTIYEGSSPHCFCSKSCMNLYISNSRHIMPCNWCKVKKYNFDMIRRVQTNGQALMMCSLNCLNLYQVSVNAVSSRRSNEQQYAAGHSGGAGRAGGRGRGQSAEPENLLIVRAERQVTQKRLASLPASKKKEYVQRKREAELHRVLPPDAPARKRRTLKPSPEREECQLVSQSPRPPSPQPSTSVLPSPPPLIVVPADIELVSANGSEVVIPAASQSKRRRSIIDFHGELFEETVLNWVLDSDSDLDDNDNDELYPTPITRQVESTTDDNLTPHQLEFLEAEDKANDRALQELLPADSLTFDWSNDKSTFKSKRENFTGNPGPTFEVTDTTTPTDIFDKMFNVQFIDTLCDETNRYARQKLDSMKDKLTPSSRFHRWTPTDRQEMITFLSVMLLQGLYPLPSEESYFSFNGFGTMPYFSKIFTFNRYLLLKSMLHFVDNDTDATKTRLFKIQPILDYFNRKFSSLFYPQQEIAIDESLLKWHGRLSYAQKINTKAAKVGVKTYELCDSSTGYLWQFSVYAGEDGTTTNNDNDDVDNNTDQTEQARTEQTLTTDFRPTNATAKIVFDLVEPLLHRGHTLIMDNFYNCPLLARCLKQRQTDCYGTQRLNREFVPASIRTMTKTDLRHGELVATYCSDLSLMVWRDANLVSMISTYHSQQIGTHNKYNRLTYKPSIVLDYNKNMGGVDRRDQFLSAQPLERVRSRVWYKKLFRRFFNVAVFNCYVIHHTKHTKLSHRQFRTILAEDLLKTYRRIDLSTETRVISRPWGRLTTTTTTTTTMTTTTTTTMTTTRRNLKLTLKNRPIVEDNHFPMRSSANRGRCWWCSQKKVLSRTVWQCIQCGVYLCIVGCFKDFHKP